MGALVSEGIWSLRNSVILGTALGLLLFFLVRRRLASGRPPWPTRARPRRVQVVVRPPPPRFGVPGPTSLEAMGQSLERAGLGTVTRRGSRLRLRAPDGDDVLIHTGGKTDGITLADLEVEASSAELCALALDALAPRVGPMELELDGAELFVDGTTPRETLQRTLHDRRMELLQQAEHRRAAEKEAKPPDRLH